MHFLFSYGTLQDPVVQLREIGKHFAMLPDTLHGFRKETIEINGNTYFIATPSANSTITGSLLTISEDDLSKFDAYETSAYTRILATVTSGRKAWVYCRPG